MNDLKIRNSMSEQGVRDKFILSGACMNRKQAMTSQKQRQQEMLLSKQKLEQPGLYFDVNQAKDTSKEDVNINRIVQRQVPQKIILRSGLVFSEHNQRLYSPHEYLHYATKVSGSKEQYLNALQQLGYEQAKQFQSRPLNEIINNTSDIIHKSYSIKYMGIIDGNMGILSNRKKIISNQKSSYQLLLEKQQQHLIQLSRTKLMQSPLLKQHFNRQQNLEAPKEDQSQIPQSPAQVVNELEEECSNLEETVTLKRKETNHSKPIQQVSLNFKQDQNQKQNRAETETHQISSNLNENIIGKHSANQMKYLVGKYSLPRGLKTLKKQRDPSLLEQKMKLEQWHAQNLHIFDDDNANELFHSQITNRSTYQGKSGFQSSSQLSNMGSSSRGLFIKNLQRTASSSSTARLKSSLYKKPIQNYEENLDEGICYAIIQDNPQVNTQSYSNLLSQISYANPNKTIPRVKSAIFHKTHQQPPGVNYQQNTSLLHRYEHIENQVFLHEQNK